MSCRKGHDWGGEEQITCAEIKVLTSSVRPAKNSLMSSMVVSGLCIKHVNLAMNCGFQLGVWFFAGFFSLSVFSFFNTVVVLFIANTRNCVCTLHQQNILVNIFWHSEVICVKYWVSAFHSAGKSKEMAGHWRSIDFQRMSLELHYKAWHQVCLNPSFHILWRRERDECCQTTKCSKLPHLSAGVLGHSCSSQLGSMIKSELRCRPSSHLLTLASAGVKDGHGDVSSLTPCMTGSAIEHSSCWFSWLFAFHFLPVGTLSVMERNAAVNLKDRVG